MSSIDKLAETFRHFPGIGPRQAKRFVYYLLTKKREHLEELSNLILEIRRDIHVCTFCQRFFNGRVQTPLCSICADETRDRNLLMVVEKDIDLENIEKSDAYNGRYFVLGGTVPILEKEPSSRVHSREFAAIAQKEMEAGRLKEVILAMSVNAEGENTAEYLSSLLSPLREKGLRISMLGRGLSTGSELEYVDSDTIKSALTHRT